jgi:hypothetical protein
MGSNPERKLVTYILLFFLSNLVRRREMSRISESFLANNEEWLKQRTAFHARM